MIIAAGYRVNSKKPSDFGRDYFDELLERIQRADSDLYF